MARSSDSPLTFAGHLEELRRRLGISLLTLLVTTGVSLVYVERIVAWLRRPAEPWLPRLAYFTPTEPLMAYFNVAGLAGLILAMPIILAQLWGFIRTGLTPKERMLGLGLIWWGSVLFLGGVAFAYFGLLPVSLRFLLGIGRGMFDPVISLDRYLSFVTTITLWCGVVFELPVILYVLARVGIVTPEWLRQQRPYAILILFIIAAIVTPTTDPINLCLMAVPMVLLYEVAVWITRYSIPTNK